MLGKKTKILSPCRIATVIILIVFVSIWGYLAVSVITDWHPFSHEALKPVYLFSYDAKIEQYHAAIPGLKYNTDTIETHDTAVSAPVYFNVSDLLFSWSPDDVSPERWLTSKAHPNNGKGIIRFDFMNKNHQILAEKYRDAELPFVLYNVPQLVNASEIFSQQNLLHYFGNVPRIVEKSTNNHFMYYTLKRGIDLMLKNPDWSPPQAEVPMTFAKFLREAEAAQAAGDSAGTKPLHYMTINAEEGGHTKWIREAFPFFVHNDPFFIVDPEGYKGINCRFGMKGVVAAAHYDGKRNFVAMVRGRKRYMLLPPSECSRMHLLSRDHPSARHSDFDWSDRNAVLDRPDFMAAKATEVVLSMGEVMYIPSYWIHFIVSQDASVQCNARSGTAIINAAEMVACGFYDEKKYNKILAGKQASGSTLRSSGNLRSKKVKQQTHHVLDNWRTIE